MTLHIYVVGQFDHEADTYIREQNGVASRCTEFVNLSRPEQLRGTRGATVVTVGTFAMRRDLVEWRRMFKERDANVVGRHWGAEEGF